MYVRIRGTDLHDDARKSFNKNLQKINSKVFRHLHIIFLLLHVLKNLIITHLIRNQQHGYHSSQASSSLMDTTLKYSKCTIMIFHISERTGIELFRMEII